MDELFKQAADEYLNTISESLPQPEDCPHTFSKRFEKQMGHLIAKTAHPLRTAMLRAVACFAAVLLLFGSVLAVDADARKAFLGWLEKRFDTYIFFSASGNTHNSVQTQYSLGWVPEGYRFEEILDEADGQTFLYANDNGDYFWFTYSSASANSNIYLFFQDGYDTKDVFINGVAGKLYLPHNETDGAGLVWQSTDGTLFEIGGKCEEAVLIRAAEKIQKNNFPRVQNRPRKTLLCVEQTKGVN